MIPPNTDTSEIVNTSCPSMCAIAADRWTQMGSGGEGGEGGGGGGGETAF